MNWKSVAKGITFVSVNKKNYPKKFSMSNLNKVILVEDNPADAQLTNLTFKNISPDSEFVSFSNGKELLSHLEEVKTPVSLIMLDLNMPQMSGTEVLKALRARDEWASIPVVVFSSSKQDVDIQNCYALGANAYVTKPFDLNEFEKTIETIASFWGNLNMRPSMV